MWRKFQWWRKRNELERDLDEELQSHFEIEGGDPAESRRVFGNTTRLREETREAWGWMAIDEFLSDTRYGLRMLRKSPGWTIVMGATLALGIGLATAIFSVIYSVLLQPLPYPQPERLVSFWTTPSRDFSTVSTGVSHFNVNPANWIDWRAQAKSFEDIGLTRPVANFNFTGDGAPVRLQGARISFNVPRILGVQPMLGRLWSEEEDHQDARVALLSYGLWERRFGKDPDILGRKLQLNGDSFEVIGVMPPDYRYPTRDFELWTPLFIQRALIETRTAFDYRSVGRLKQGVPMAQAQEEMLAIMKRLAQQYPATNSKLGVYLEPFMESEVGSVKETLWALLEAVGCLLLIGCLSLGGLLVARSNARGREMTLRAALGASGLRLRRQMLAEVLPLSIGGVAGGIALAWVLLRVLKIWLPPTMPRTEEIALHGPVLAFSVALSVAIVVLAGLLPAALAARTHLAGALQSATRSVTGGGRLRRTLVIAQVAITLVVLFAGSLLARSLAEALTVNLGFQTDHLLTMHMEVANSKYPENRQVSDYYERLVARIKAIPGVLEAAFVNRLPLNGTQTNPIEFENKMEAGVVNVNTRSATPGYFVAMGIPVVKGRPFDAQDRPDSSAVGLIDDSLARKIFPNEDPIGKRFRFSLGTLRGPWVEIVGVVGHIRNEGPESDRGPQVYWPLSQRAQNRAALVVRTSGPPESLTKAVLAQIHAEDPDQAMYDIRSLDEWMDRTLQTRVLTTGLIAIFGSAALLLACLGLYGVVSYNSGLRLREFGIRLALGARTGDIRGIVLGQAGGLVLIGSAIGLLLVWPVGRLIEGLLFGVRSTDLFSILIAPALLLVVALLAALGPAIRASRVNPAVSLRAD